MGNIPAPPAAATSRSPVGARAFACAVALEYLELGCHALADRFPVDREFARLVPTDRHRHQEWLHFLRVIDQVTPAGKGLHFIPDNSGSHKHTKVQRWWKRHSRFHVHFTTSEGDPQQFEMWSQTYRWRDRN